MNFKQCAASIIALIEAADLSQKVEMLRLYATCLTLVEECRRLHQIDTGEETLSPDAQYNVGCLVGSVENIRLATFEDEGNGRRIAAAISDAQKVK